MIIQDVLLIPISSVATDKTLKQHLAKGDRIVSAIPVPGSDYAYMHYVIEHDVPNHRPIEDTISKTVTYSLQHLHTAEVKKYVGKSVYFADLLEDFNEPLEISILAPIYDEDDAYEDEITGLRFKYMRPILNKKRSKQNDRRRIK